MDTAVVICMGPHGAVCERVRKKRQIHRVMVCAMSVPKSWISGRNCSHCLGGTLHVFFEGYFVLNNSTIGSKQTLFAQLWKEYALSDSRYLSGDLVVLCAEALTLLLWGPLSYLTAVAIVRSSAWRHPLQIIVSMGQCLGDLLYMSTSLVDLYARHNLYSRPEPYYLWFYFFSLNAIWLVVPGSM